MSIELRGFKNGKSWELIAVNFFENELMVARFTTQSRLRRKNLFPRLPEKFTIAIKDTSNFPRRFSLRKRFNSNLRTKSSILFVQKMQIFVFRYATQPSKPLRVRGSRICPKMMNNYIRSTIMSCGKNIALITIFAKNEIKSLQVFVFALEFDFGESYFHWKRWFRTKFAKRQKLFV